MQKLIEAESRMSISTTSSESEEVVLARSKARTRGLSKQPQTSGRPAQSTQPSSRNVSSPSRATPTAKAQADETPKQQRTAIHPSHGGQRNSANVRTTKAAPVSDAKVNKIPKQPYIPPHLRNPGQQTPNVPVTDGESPMSDDQKAKATKQHQTPGHHQSSQMNTSGNRVTSISHNQAKNGRSSKDASPVCSPNESSPTPKQKKPPVAMKKDPYECAPQEVLDELKRLQQPIILQAHLNRFKDETQTSPETLAKARNGPGTDVTSEACAEIQAVRELAATAVTMGAGVAATRIFPHPELPHGPRRFSAQWTAYKDSPILYPTVVEEGKVIYSSKAAPGQGFAEFTEKFQKALGPGEETGARHAPEKKWAETSSVNWEHRPRICSQYEGFRDWFRNWLDTTMKVLGPVDIFHESFFDGSAHPDGMGSLYVGDFEHGFTNLDLDDEETRLHHHETALGYMHNIALYLKNLKKEERAKKIRARAAYIESLKHVVKPNPNVPSANIYLRPVEAGDAGELVTLMNWYMINSPLSTDDEMRNQDHVRQRIESSRVQQLPFIVAVQRRTPGTGQSASAPEKVVGYATANDFISRESSIRYTAKLQLFVRNDSQRQGIGRCLMDKILELCDPHHNAKCGYHFETSNSNGVPYQGCGRKLCRLIFLISYPDHDRASHVRLFNWLKKYNFEEQGVLKGIGVKFGRQ